jgi:hypothetical protein
MIVYNITIKIEPGIEKDWLQWQRGEHIPDIMATGQFHSYKMFRLLEQDEEDGITYVVQYMAETIEQYQHYVNTHSALLLQKAFKRWGNRFIAFRSVMEVVH